MTLRNIYIFFLIADFLCKIDTILFQSKKNNDTNVLNFSLFYSRHIKHYTPQNFENTNELVKYRNNWFVWNWFAYRFPQFAQLESSTIESFIHNHLTKQLLS